MKFQIESLIQKHYQVNLLWMKLWKWSRGLTLVIFKSKLSYCKRHLLSDEVAVSTCMVQRSTTNTEINYHISYTVAIQSPLRDWKAIVSSYTLQVLKPRRSHLPHRYRTVVSKTQKLAKSIMLRVLSCSIPISQIKCLHKMQLQRLKIKLRRTKIRNKMKHRPPGEEPRWSLSE